jgi:hypothetical protein
LPLLHARAGQWSKSLKVLIAYRIVCWDRQHISGFARLADAVSGPGHALSNPSKVRDGLPCLVTCGIFFGLLLKAARAQFLRYRTCMNAPNLKFIAHIVTLEICTRAPVTARTSDCLKHTQYWQTYEMPVRPVTSSTTIFVNPLALLPFPL